MEKPRAVPASDGDHHVVVRPIVRKLLEGHFSDCPTHLLPRRVVIRELDTVIVNVRLPSIVNIEEVARHSAGTYMPSCRFRGSGTCEGNQTFTAQAI
jgi:hypothetical protein